MHESVFDLASPKSLRLQNLGRAVGAPQERERERRCVAITCCLTTNQDRKGAHMLGISEGFERS